MITLRDDQLELTAAVRQCVRDGATAVLAQAPTGFGKTVVGGDFMAGAHLKGNRSLFSAHRIELIEQAIRTLRGDMGLPLGVIAPGYPADSTQRMQVGMVQTINNRLTGADAPDFLLIDEAHRTANATNQKMLAKWPQVAIVGLTATPQRLDGRGLRPPFQAIVCGPSPRWLIDRGLLADFDYYAPSEPADDELATVKQRGGDYDTAGLAAVMAGLTGDVVATFRRLAAPGARALCFAADRDHSEQIAAAFNTAGITAEHVDGKTHAVDRRTAMARFRAGQTQVLCNVELFTEGVDVPDANVVIMARPTESLSLYLQMIGRVLRAAPGKRAVVIDHAGNLWRHGPPDLDRQWSLDGTRRTPLSDEVLLAIRQCSWCTQVFRAGGRCDCGHVEAAGKPRRVLVREGELQRAVLDHEKWVAEEARKAAVRQQIREARSLQAFQQIECSQGYAPGWARIRWAARGRR